MHSQAPDQHALLHADCHWGHELPDLKTAGQQRQSGRYPATCSAAGSGSAAAEGALQDSIADKAAKEEDRLPPWALTFDLRERETGTPSQQARAFEVWITAAALRPRV